MPNLCDSDALIDRECLELLTRDIPPFWSPLTMRLSHGSPVLTCRLAVLLSVWVVTLGGEIFFALGFYTFLQLHRKKEIFSFIQVSLLASDAVAAVCFANLATFFLALESMLSNLSCLNPLRMYLSRAFFDIPAFGMQMTGCVLLIACCLDRIQAMARPVQYRVINRRKRCLLINLSCYVVGWLYAFLAHCLNEPPNIRSPHNLSPIRFNSSRDLVCSINTGAFDDCFVDPFFSVKFWYSAESSLLSCRSNHDWMRPGTLREKLPFVPDINIGLSIVLIIANVSNIDESWRGTFQL